MKLLLRSIILFVVFASSVYLNAQQAASTPNCPGVPGACGYPSTAQTRTVPSNPTPQNGNGTLGQIYNFTKCGLGFTQATMRLGRRFTPQGAPQPATFAISGIPACAIIEQAYLWAEGSGTGAAQTATIVNPASVSQSFPMTVVGSGPDKCWGYAGSHTYRANVTSVISGNGNYIISGLLTNPPNPGNDMDGATLMIIYSDPTATFRGTMVIHDGAVVINGGTTTQVLNGMTTVCQNVSAANATAFCMVGDIQLTGQTCTMNGTNAPFVWNWWNYVQVNTALTNGQTTANYTMTSGGDCFNLSVIGMYFRTTCTPCTLSTLTLTPAITPATCTNCNGSATVNVAPAGAYTYSWAPSGGNAATATGLCPGTYTVTVSNACASQTVLVTITSSGGGLTVNNAAQTNIDCFGNCIGSASVTVTGGTAPFTYSWTPNPSATALATGLCAGTYTCNVSDFAGCTGNASFTITQPTAVTNTTTQTNVGCFGGNSGTTTITASGGTPGYSFSWSPAVPNITIGNSNTASGLTAGTYVCTTTDGNGCISTTTVVITQPSTLAIASTQVDVSCFGTATGSTTMTGSGGSPGYTFAWTPSVTNTSTGNSNTGTGLIAGSYACTVTDLYGCTATTTVTITEPPLLTATSLQGNVSCASGGNGTSTVTASGGNGNYTFSWSPSVTSTTSGNTNTASGLALGSYVCTITDGNNCSTTLTVVITQPAALASTLTVTDATCAGGCNGTVTAAITGGSPNYTYAWSGGCTTAACTNVCAGTQTLTVTDNLGCVLIDSITVTEPAAMTVQMLSTAAFCNQPNGGVNAIGSGGTGNLSYLWTPGNLPQQSSNVIPPGNYTVTITDQNNCQLIDSVTVANIAGVSLTGNPSTSVSCFGGSNGTASVTATGGVGPYVYAWAPNVSTTNAASNLTAGSYVVIAVDSAGCTSTTTVTVTQPVQLTTTASATPGAICLGQSLSLNALPVGGTPSYNAVWQPGNLTNLVQPLTPTTSGTYSLTITDANGCTATAQTTITVSPPPAPQFTGTPTQGCAPLCVNFTDQTGPGSWSWSWDFGDGNTNTTTGTPTNCYTVPGTYDVQLTVTDIVTGCSTTISYAGYITAYPSPTAAFGASPQPATMVNPTIYFTDSSSGAASWLWSFGDVQNSSSILQNPSFTYPGADCYLVSLTVTNANGCTDLDTQTVCIGLDATLFVPNAFTPNGDGDNDVFFPMGIGIESNDYQLWIYDRWGNQIFFSDNPSIGWDGHANGGRDMAQIDTYVWRLKCIDVTGTRHNLLGKVTLIE